ncbi:MAG: endonuclease/exonuclease/phosphatase family protein [Ktedonobacteraceae bacterium]
MNIRYVSWNIHGKNQITPMVNLLHRINGDLIALQEVTVSAYRTLVESKLFAWSTFSLDLRPRQVNEGPGRRLGCALLGQASFHYKSSSLLEDAPFPERTLIAEVETLTGPLTLCSFHTPPGATWKKKKPQALLALAQWLAHHQTRVIVGMDANAPKSDHLDIEQNEWWWKEEPLMLGARPLHTLRDALRVWLTMHPLEAARLLADSPQGPLAVSYNRGWGKRAFIPCRYDFIYLTPDFSVSEVRYLYAEAIQVGSDHALVMADLFHTTEHIHTAEHIN